MLQEPSFLCGEERSLVFKHFLLSSTLLSPAQTCFRCPSELSSAAELWEALAQCPHSLRSAGWSFILTRGRQCVGHCLSLAMNSHGAVSLKTVSKVRKREAPPSPVWGDHVSFPAWLQLLSKPAHPVPNRDQHKLCAGKPSWAWWAVVRKQQVLCMASQQLAGTSLWKQGAATAPQLSSGESTGAWQVSNCQKDNPKLPRNTHVTVDSKDFLTHSPISTLGCHSSQLATSKKHPENSICCFCQPKSQCTSCNKQMGKGRVYLGKHFGIRRRQCVLGITVF